MIFVMIWPRRMCRRCINSFWQNMSLVMKGLSLFRRVLIFYKKEIKSTFNIEDDKSHRHSKQYSSDSSDNETESSSDSEDDEEFFKNLRKGVEIPPAKCAVNGPVKTKGELLIQDLPPVEYLQVSVSPTELQKNGNVLHLFIDEERLEFFVVVESDGKTNALEHDSLLFLSSGEPLGKIYEVLGITDKPLYTVRFNKADDIFSKGVTKGQDVFFVPENPEFTRHILIEALKKFFESTRQKGSDASWRDNNEPPDEEIDYSDDELEKLAKQKRRAKTRGKERYLDDGVEENMVPKKMERRDGPSRMSPLNSHTNPQRGQPMGPVNQINYGGMWPPSGAMGPFGPQTSSMSMTGQGQLWNPNTSSMNSLSSSPAIHYGFPTVSSSGGQSSGTPIMPSPQGSGLNGMYTMIKPLPGGNMPRFPMGPVPDGPLRPMGPYMGPPVLNGISSGPRMSPLNSHMNPPIGQPMGPMNPVNYGGMRPPSGAMGPFGPQISSMSMMGQGQLWNPNTSSMNSLSSSPAIHYGFPPVSSSGGQGSGTPIMPSLQGPLGMSPVNPQRGQPMGPMNPGNYGGMMPPSGAMGPFGPPTSSMSIVQPTTPLLFFPSWETTSLTSTNFMTSKPCCTNSMLA